MDESNTESDPIADTEININPLSTSSSESLAEIVNFFCVYSVKIKNFLFKFICKSQE